MAKKRKTRKQKIISDHRSQDHPMITSNQVQDKAEIPKAYVYSSSPSVSQARTTTTVTADYQYVTKDLLRTAIVTGAIVTLELILFFSTKGLNG